MRSGILCHLLIVVFFFNCKNTLEKSDNTVILPKAICIDNCTNFNLQDSIVYQNLRNTDALAGSLVNDNIKKIIISKTNNYYEIYLYSKLKIDNCDAMIFYGTSDYYEEFILASNNFDDLKVISSILGDGELLYLKKSFFEDKVFYTEFLKVNRTFTEPDTILFKNKGKSTIKISPTNKIIEDTINDVKNKIEIITEPGYNIEANW